MNIVCHVVHHIFHSAKVAYWLLESEKWSRFVSWSLSVWVCLLLSLHLSFFVSVCVSVCQSFTPFLYIWLCLFVWVVASERVLSACLYESLSASLNVCALVCLRHLSLSQSLSLSVPVSLSVSVCKSAWVCHLLFMASCLWTCLYLWMYLVCFWVACPYACLFLSGVSVMSVQCPGTCLVAGVM